MLATASQADLEYLRRMVLRHSGNSLDPSRDYLLETRLSPLLQSLHLNGLGAFVSLLKSQDDAVVERAAAEAMTINETSFFRDVRPFELLRTQLLPQLIEARSGVRALRFWSAACSSGQEAYSIAMLLREDFPAIGNWNVRIDGTDISSRVLEQASAGRYHRIEINRGLPARHIPRFFDHEGDYWVVKPELRSACSFQRANLCAGSLPFRSPFDVILLRNVLLYFSSEVRRVVLAQVHRLVAPDGVLLLGASEQPPTDSCWKVELAGGACFMRPT